VELYIPEGGKVHFAGEGAVGYQMWWGSWRLSVLPRFGVDSLEGSQLVSTAGDAVDEIGEYGGPVPDPDPHPFTGERITGWQAPVAGVYGVWSYVERMIGGQVTWSATASVVDGSGDRLLDDGPECRWREELFGGWNPALVNGRRCRVQVGCPVDSFSGNFWHTFDDLSVPGRGPGLAVSRTYNALGGGDGRLGFGWSFSYGMVLRVGADVATVSQENGSRVSFDSDGAGAWAAPPRVDATLVRDGDGSWAFTRASREVFGFDAAGRLVRVEDLNGEATVLAYDAAGWLVSATDPSGRVVSFGYDAAGRIVSATDPAGRTVGYSYSPEGDLVEVVDVAGGVTTFGYDGVNRPGLVGGSMPWKRGWSHAYTGSVGEADDASLQRRGEGSGGAAGPPAAS